MGIKKINAVNKTVLFISDLHLPYTHKDYLKFLRALKKKHKPDIIICTGDEVDGHAISFHDTDSALFSADKELDLAIKLLGGLCEVFPKMILLESNHGSLIFRRMKAHGIPIRNLKTLPELYETPNWEWFDSLLIKTSHPLPTYVCHGKTAAYNKLAREQGCNAIQSHFHGKFEITWARTAVTERYNMIIGCFVDIISQAFAYGKNHMPQPILGCAMIDKEGTPHLLKMNLNKKGNWDGKI